MVLFVKTTGGKPDLSPQQFFQNYVLKPLVFQLTDPMNGRYPLFIDIDHTGADLELYELSSDFGSESSVTWDSFGGGVTPGVNAGAAPVATINGLGNKVTVDITSSVASWAAGANNFGWALI